MEMESPQGNEDYPPIFYATIFRNLHPDTLYQLASKDLAFGNQNQWTTTLFTAVLNREGRAHDDALGEAGKKLVSLSVNER